MPLHTLSSSATSIELSEHDLGRKAYSQNEFWPLPRLQRINKTKWTFFNESHKRVKDARGAFFNYSSALAHFYEPSLTRHFSPLVPYYLLWPFWAGRRGLRRGLQRGRLRGLRRPRLVFTLCVNPPLSFLVRLQLVERLKRIFCTLQMGVSHAKGAKGRRPRRQSAFIIVHYSRLPGPTRVLRLAILLLPLLDR